MEEMKKTIYPSAIYEAVSSNKSAVLTTIAEQFSKLLRKTIDQPRAAEQQETTGRPIAPGINWKEAFEGMANHILDFASKAGWPMEIFELIKPEDILVASEAFVTELNGINMEEMLFDDMRKPGGLSGLLANCSNLTLWTMGDIANGNQKAKIASSGIEKRMEDAKDQLDDHRVDINLCIIDRKTDAIPSILDNFWKEKGEPEKIAIVLIDDSRSNFTNGEREIANWEARNRKRVAVTRVYVRSRRGKNAAEKWRPIARPIHEGKSVEDFAEITSRVRGNDVSPENTIILLDFDGTVVDNDKLRKKQLQLVHEHLHGMLEELAGKWLKVRERREMEKWIEYGSPDQAEKDRRYIRTLLGRVAPLSEIDSAFCKQTAIFRKLEAEIGYNISNESKETLEELDAVYHTSGGLIPSYVFVEMIEGLELENETRDYMYEIGAGSEKTRNKGEFVDDAYFKNPRRKGKRSSGILKMHYNLTSETVRYQAKCLAEEMELKIKDICRDENGKEKWRFVSGGIKSRESMEEKIERKGSGHLNEIYDLVRGEIIVDDLTQLAECSTALTREFDANIVRYNNYFRSPYFDEKEELRPVKQCKLVFRLSDEVSYELQIKTRRAKASGELDHETTMKDSVKLKYRELEYIRSISWIANILDYHELLQKRNPDFKRSIYLSENPENINEKIGGFGPLIVANGLSLGINLFNPEIYDVYMKKILADWHVVLEYFDLVLWGEENIEPRILNHAKKTIEDYRKYLPLEVDCYYSNNGVTDYFLSNEKNAQKIQEEIIVQLYVLTAAFIQAYSRLPKQHFIPAKPADYILE